jgi:hypothetical protein
VLNKSAKTITGILVALAAYGVTALPAQAAPIQPKQDILIGQLAAKANPIQPKQEVLISQLAGHEVYKKENQLMWQDYVLGRVRGKVGNILMIEFLKYGPLPGYIDLGDGNKMTHYHMEGAAEPGDDVILRPEFVNGKFASMGMIDSRYIQTFVTPAHPYWVSRLNIKAVPVVEKSAINFESSAPVSLPPVQPSAAPVFQPAPAPVRGMW